MNASNHRWLQEQLPAWEKDGLITAENAAALRQRHPVEEPGVGLAQMIMGSIGALLVGAGLITIIAYNWDDFTCPVRLMFAFLPLAGAQVLTFLVLKRGSAWLAWVRECAALFQACASAACLALVSQMYNLGGEWPEFLLACLLLSLPLVWLLRPTSVVILYLIGTAVWAVNQGWERPVWHQSALLYPLLLAALYPFWPGAKRDQRLSTTLRWILVLSIYAALLGMIEASMRLHGYNDWYSSDRTFWLWELSIAVLLLFPLPEQAVAERNRQKPQVVLGTIQLVGFGLGMTFMDSHAVRSLENALHTPWAWVCVVLGITFAMLAVMRRRWAVLSIAGILAVPFVALLFGERASGALPLLMNVYLLALGVILIVLEFSGRHGAPRLGATLISILIICRMAESDLSLLFKGITFILIGCAFIAFNIAMSRLLRRQKASAS
jgi:uncharacterized membrane protein